MKLMEMLPSSLTIAKVRRGKYDIAFAPADWTVLGTLGS